MKLHVLHCGEISISETAVSCPKSHGYLRDMAAMRLCREEKRVSLPVSCYLIEHPRGLILVDTGLCRDISPAGKRDPRASAAVLSSSLEAFYHPTLPLGAAIDEKLSAMGIAPSDLSCVILTHLDSDHVAGLRHLRGAGRIILPEDEYFWACRTVYKRRQPWSLWIDFPIERLFYRGSPLGPNRWAIDLFGDDSLSLINLPGHTDGMAGVLLRDGARSLLLAGDAAFSSRNWEESVAPGFCFSRRMALKSLDWIRRYKEETGCQVLCSHDPAVPEGTLSF